MFHLIGETFMTTLTSAPLAAVFDDGAPRRT
jgi:hypothetical protein